MGSRQTYVRLSFCPGEQQLEKACNNFAALAQDVNHVREQVSKGVIRGEDVQETARLGVEDVIKYGKLAKGARENLAFCLARIASGDCVAYELRTD